MTGKRADGYHLIDSLVVFTRFGDRIETAAADEDSLEVTGRYGEGVPRDGDNLVLKARDALRAHVGQDSAPPVAISLEKNLPVASGVGGGSSDAAATLRSLAKSVAPRPRQRSEMTKLGASLGADVPMCLAAKPLLARGTGDELTMVPDFPSLGLVLVNPGVGVATTEVFKALANADNEGLPPLPARSSSTACATGWNRPATISARRPDDHALDPLRTGGIDQGRCRLCPHVGLGRHLLRPL